MSVVHVVGLATLPSCLRAVTLAVIATNWPALAQAVLHTIAALAAVFAFFVLTIDLFSERERCAR